MRATLQKKFREKVKKLTDPKSKDTKVNFGKDEDEDKKKTSVKSDSKKEENQKDKPARSDSSSKSDLSAKDPDKNKAKKTETPPNDPEAAKAEADKKKADRLGPPKKVEDPGKPKVKIDFDPVLEADLQFIFDNDLEDLNEYEDVVLDLCEELSQIDEVLSMSARFRKRAVLRRNRNRIRIGRQRALRRKATTERITRRARRSAISTMKRKFAGGRSLSSLSFADRARVEKIVAKRPRAVQNLTRRNIRIKRQQERQRFNRRNLRNQVDHNNSNTLNEYVQYMEMFLTEWEDDGSSGGIGSPYQSGNAIANNINYNEQLRNVCAELNVSPLELTKMAQTLGKYAHELSASQARAIVSEYRKKYDK